MSACGKIPYSSAAEARRAIVKTVNRAGFRADRGSRQSAYFCEACSAWHWGNSLNEPTKRRAVDMSQRLSFSISVVGQVAHNIRRQAAERGQGEAQMIAEAVESLSINGLFDEVINHVPKD